MGTTPGPHTPSWRKYLFETLAIMVGVFGAFALNNWNENRRLEQLEQEALEQLSADLQRSVESVADCSESHKRIIRDAGSVLEHMAGTAPYDDSLSYLLASSFFYTDLDTDLGAYKTMQSHGVDIVTNDELRNLIIQHFEQRLTVMQRREDILYDFADKVKLQEGQKYFDYTFELEGFERDGKTATSWNNVRLRSVPRDYEDLRTSVRVALPPPHLHGDRQVVRGQYAGLPDSDSAADRDDRGRTGYPLRRLVRPAGQR